MCVLSEKYPIQDYDLKPCFLIGGAVWMFVKTGDPEDMSLSERSISLETNFEGLLAQSHFLFSVSLLPVCGKKYD